MTVSSHVPLLHAAVRDKLRPELAARLGEPYSTNPGHAGSFDLPLESGHLARIDLIDDYGMIIEGTDGEPWRGVTFETSDGKPMDDETDMEVLAAASVAAIEEVVRRDGDGTLGQFGIDLSSPHYPPAIAERHKTGGNTSS